MTVNGVCDRPPPGWWCSRESGHGGPCSARSTDNVSDERALELLAAVDRALEEDGPWLELQKSIRAFLRSKGR